jgi:tetratricopeptide (TPR) repeat protein
MTRRSERVAPNRLVVYNRGNLLREAGRLAEAVASYDVALRLDPAYPEALPAGGPVLRDLFKHRRRSRRETEKGSDTMTISKAMNFASAAFGVLGALALYLVQRRGVSVT